MNETRPKPSVVGDRSLGLVVFGVVEIAIGGCCLVLAPLTIAAAVIGGPLGGAGSNFWSAMSVSMSRILYRMAGTPLNLSLALARIA